MKEKSSEKVSIRRFLTAQDSLDNSYKSVLFDIQNGKKINRPFNYIFPTIRGDISALFDDPYYIEGFNEAEEYLQNEVLRNRLIEISEAVLNLTKNNFEIVFGGHDAERLQQCMTLFYEADPQIKVFKDILDKFYGGRIDSATFISIRKTRSINDWQLFLPNTVSKDSTARMFLKEMSDLVDVSTCFQTDEEISHIVDEVRRGDKEAKDKLFCVLFPVIMNVSVDYLGRFGLLYDNMMLGIESINETITEYELRPYTVLANYVREKTIKKIEDIKSSANIRMLEKEKKRAMLEFIAEIMSDEKERSERITSLSIETGISEEKIDELLNHLYL